MAAVINEITGKFIKTGVATEEYKNNWEVIFGKNKEEIKKDLEEELEKVNNKNENEKGGD